MGNGCSSNNAAAERGAMAAATSAATLAEDEVYYNYNSAAALKPAAYAHGKPSVAADEAIGCFSTTNERGELLSPPGLLYRLIREEDHQWHFYNDTKDFNMVVTGYFGAMNKIRALGTTKMWREMPSGLLVLEVVVPPLATCGYVEGIVNDGYDLRFKALPAAASSK